jgi:hypothetical protein
MEEGFWDRRTQHIKTYRVAPGSGTKLPPELWAYVPVAPMTFQFQTAEAVSSKDLFHAARERVFHERIV